MSDSSHSEAGPRLRGDLSGRVILVTGAAQGVGAAVARAAAHWSAAGIVLTDRNREMGEAVRDEVAKIGCRAEFVRGELGTVEDCHTIIDFADRAFGRLDGLVNAAALTDRGDLLHATSEFWDRVFAVNARAPFLLMQGAARIMRREKSEAAIVNITSMNAHCGAAKLTVYSAAKAALVNLTRNSASALLHDRIRVNAINLGWVDTPNERIVQARESPLGEGWLEEARRSRPFGRLIEPVEVADVVAFLLSPQSGVMTGSIVDYEQWVAGSYPEFAAER